MKLVKVPKFPNPYSDNYFAFGFRTLPPRSPSEPEKLRQLQKMLSEEMRLVLALSKELENRQAATSIKTRQLSSNLDSFFGSLNAESVDKLERRGKEITEKCRRNISGKNGVLESYKESIVSD